MEEIPKRLTQIARLQRDKTAAEEAYAALNKKLQDIRLAKEATISMAEIVRPALVPESSELPRNIILIAGLLLGLLLGGVAAVGRHKFDTRIYTPEDLEARNFRSIGVVPDLHLVPDSKKRLRSAEREEEDTDVDREREKEEKPRVASALEKPTAASEAYRRLHLNLQLSRNGDPVRTVMVTSPEPGAGKSTTALNLAATAARAGRRTLVVDADFRQQQIQALTGSAKWSSLEDLLANPEDEVDYSEFSTGLPNLYAISQRDEMVDAGAGPGLSSPEMEQLFERLRSAFDLVVFDTPPVLAVADAIFLATRCDATLIVVQAGKTDVEELEQTSDDLRDARAEIVGTVLNRFNPSEPSSYTSRYQYQDYAEASEAG
jgi:capsular exopolysaccharide synthesis family protein